MSSPTFDDIFAVMAAASVGDVDARVPLPDELNLDETETRFAIALNILLDDLAAKADAQRALMAAIVDSSDDAIISKTLDGVITSWNLGAEHLFGFKADEIVGHPMLEFVPPERHEEHRSMLRVLAHGAVMRVDTTRRHQNGNDIDVSITMSPIRDVTGTVVGISTIARDITDRLRFAARLARAKETAEAANRELEAFSYSVAHDLRSPLRAMNGYAHLLLDEYRDKFDPQATIWLDSIQNNAKRMADLIDGLLALARLNRSELKLEAVDIARLARDALAECSASEPTRKVDLVAPDELVVRADAGLARGLIGNLVGNSWKFTRDAASPCIEIGRAIEHDSFYVRDNGVGFDMAFANKLFVPFQRLHAPSEFPGSGIGLATVQRIVHRHGGRIEVSGAVGVGAMFKIILSSSSPSLVDSSPSLPAVR